MRGLTGKGLSDCEIIERSLDVPDAFEEIFARHYRTIYRYAARRLGVEEADDIATEVFLRAFDLRDRFDLDRSSCRPWLFGIASNICRSESRRRYRESRAVRRISVEPLLVESASDIAWRVDAQRRVADCGLIAAINDLRSEERETLLLFALADATYAEIAEALGVPIGTVRSRLSRTRDKLREPLRCLGDAAGEAETS